MGEMRGSVMLRWCAVCLLVVGFVPAHALSAENGPQCCGTNGEETSEANALPTKRSETENVKWKTPLHDKGWSSPVVWRDQSGVIAAAEDGTKDYAICIDKNSGKLIHDIHLWDND